MQRLGAPAGLHKLHWPETRAVRDATGARRCNRGCRTWRPARCRNGAARSGWPAPAPERRRARAGPGEPSRQGQPPPGRAGARERRLGLVSIVGVGQEGGNPGPDLLARRGEIAPNQERDFRRCASTHRRPRRSGPGRAAAVLPPPRSPASRASSSSWRHLARRQSFVLRASISASISFSCDLPAPHLVARARRSRSARSDYASARH